MKPAGSAAGCRAGAEARLELVNKVSRLARTQMILGEGVADMAKSVGAGMGRLGGTVGSQPGSLSPSICPASDSPCAVHPF